MQHRHPMAGRGHGFVAGTVMAAALAATPLPASPQAIRIPDFRNEAPAAKTCPDCGTVRSIREVSSRRSRDIPAGVTQPAVPATGPGGESNIVGGVLVHGFGGGETTNYVGGVGTPEMQQRWTDTSYEVTLRMDDGSYRVVERRDGNRFRPGDRVRMTQGTLDKI